MSSRRKRGAQARYFTGSHGRKNSSEYCSDRRLLPRIKQLLEGTRDPVDIDEIAQALQETYPEYARRKQLVFRQLVEKVYSGIEDTENSDWLERREKEHIRKWQTKNPDGHVSVDSDSGQELLLTDSEAEMDVYDGNNMMNNSIVQLYGSTNTATKPSEKSPSFTIDKVPEALPEDNGTKNTTKLALETCPMKQEEENSIEPRSKKPKRSQEDLVAARKEKPKKRRAKERSHPSKDVSSAVQENLSSRHKQEFKVQSSTVLFSDVGGCESVLEDVCRLLLHMRHPEVFARLGVRPPQGFLLHGPPGCGKTLLAHAIAGELKLPFLKLAATEVVSGVSGESEGTIRDLFQVAKDNAPCVLFIDEVDAICPKRETAQREMERRIVTQLLTCLDDLNQSESGAQVLVIGATSRADSLDPALRRSGRFDKEISLGIPSVIQRESILRLHCANLRLEDGFDFKAVSEASPGFVGADLVALVREASLCAINRLLSAAVGSEPSSESQLVSVLRHQTTFPEALLETIFIKQLDFSEALKSVQPSAKREGFATVPDTTWDDVGALEEIREELSMAILAPVRYPEQFSRLGLTAPPGVLLAGPPGCGKTLLAKAIANESGINFISVKGPELLNMYVGESERAVRQVFQRARNSSPCVIFFDELDSLCPRRSDNSQSNASARVVNQLLTEMDGIQSRRQVFVMGATNRPDIIDPAILRPGRLDKVLYVGLPTEQDRRDILHTITKGGSKPKLAAEIDLTQLSSKCNGFSGADLSALVREAAIISLKEYMKMKPEQNVLAVEPNMEVTMEHFEIALGKLRPSVTPQDCVFYEEMAKRFTQHKT